MPTDPLPALLDRYLSVATAQEVINTACPLLQELVNHGTNVLARCQSSVASVDVDVAPLALYRQQLEMVDGIEVLLSAACVSPAVPLLRSAFEGVLGLEYICEAKESYDRRSLSWLLGYIHQKLDLYDRLTPTTTKGQEFSKLLDADEVVRGALEVPGGVEAARAHLAKMLEKPHLQPIQTEFCTFGKKRPEWFHLFSGPQNLRELAIHLNRGAQYELLYRAWSRVVHAQDFRSFIDCEGATKRLRDPAELRAAASFAASFVLASTRIMIDKFRNGENLEPWYLREVRDRHQRLSRNPR